MYTHKEFLPSCWKSHFIINIMSLTRNLVSRATRSIPRVRYFADLGIPSDAEQAYGRRKLELDAEAKGLEYFGKEPIIPKHDQGTKENPILVPSCMPWRGVGYEDPSSHQLAWFRLTKGSLHYIPEIGLYFKMLEIKDAH